MGLKLVEPREVLAVKILVGREERIIEPGAFVLIGRAAAQRAVDEGSDPALLGFSPITLARFQHRIGAGRHAGAKLVAIGQPRRQFLFDLRGKARLPFGQLTHIVPRHQRSLLLPPPLEQLGKAQLGAEIEPVKRQGPVKRGALARVIAAQAVGMGQIAPQRQGPGIGRGGAGEGFNRSGPIAGAYRGHALGVGFKRFARRLVRGLGHDGARDRPAPRFPQGGVAARRRPL